MMRVAGKYVMIVGAMFLVTTLGLQIFAIVSRSEQLRIPLLWTWLGCFAFFGAGVLLWVLGGKRDREKITGRQAIIRNGKRAEGEIVFADADYQFLVNSRPVYGLAEVAFTDSLGTQQRFTARELDLRRLASSGLKAGDKVTVFYFNVEPDKAIFLWPDEKIGG